MDRHEIVRRLSQRMRWNTDGRTRAELRSQLSLIRDLTAKAAREQRRLEKLIVPLDKWRRRGDARIVELEEALDD